MLVPTTAIPELTLANSPSARRYVIVWAVTLAAAWGLFSGFTAVVDPYKFIGTPRWPGFNAHKYKMSEFGRIAKLRELGRRKPQAIILGDSQAEGGLRSETLARLTGQSAYNASFLGARIEETEVAFRHAIAVAPIRSAVLALDYVAFEGGVDRAAILGARANRELFRELADFAELTMSWQAFTAAAGNVLNNRRGQLPSHDVNGNWTVYEDVPIDDNAPPGESSPPVESAYRAFENICALAVKKNVDLRVFITPIHRAFGIDLAARSVWVERVRAIAEKYGHAVLDAGADAAFNADKKNFFDRLHFTPDVGNAILKKLFSGSGVASARGAR